MTHLEKLQKLVQSRKQAYTLASESVYLAYRTNEGLREAYQLEFEARQKYDRACELLLNFERKQSGYTFALPKATSYIE